MANITISALASVDTTSAQFAQQHAGKVTGEAIAAGQPVELRTDGKLYKYAGTTGAAFFGISPRSAGIGRPLTTYGQNVQFRASDGGLTIGKKYFLSDTVGQIADAAGTKDAVGTFLAISANDLIVTRGYQGV